MRSPVGPTRPDPVGWGLTAALGALLAPALAGALLADPARSHAPPLGHCLLLDATGVPCPACGATRAFICLFHGDPSVTHYNWAWLVWWALGCALVGLLITRRRRGRPLLGPRSRALVDAARVRPGLVVAFALGLMALSWSVALANLHWIARA